MNETIIRPREAAKRCGISLVTFWGKLNPKDKRHDPAFPRPFKINGENSRAVGILQSELEAWIAKQAEKRI